MIIIIFPFGLIIIILAICIIYTATRDSIDAPPRRYNRTSPRDPWVPVAEPRQKARVWEPSQHLVDVLICSCGKWNAPEQTVCWNCSTPLSAISRETFTFETVEKCAVCGFWVYEGEELVLCPSCNAQGHRAHMLEFLKAKGVCPVCSQKLYAHQLLKTIPKV